MKNKLNWVYLMLVIVLIAFLILFIKYLYIFKLNEKLTLKNKELLQQMSLYKQQQNNFDSIYKKIYEQTKDKDKSLYLAVCINKVLNEIDSKFEFINENLVISIIKVESNYDRTAQSSVGAMGYMQIKQSTADWLYKKYKLKIKPDLYKTYNNIYYGVFYLNYIANKLKNKYPKSILPALVLLAYNEGPNSKKVKRMSYAKHKYVNKVFNNIMLL